MKNILKVLVLCFFFANPAEQQISEERHRSPEPKLFERYKWNLIDFSYENDAERQSALENRSYIPNNTIPFGVGVWQNKAFITVPRRKPGVPSTLNYVDLNLNESAPLLKPYPNWASNQPTAGNIISVYRISVDSCDRLWAMDSGSVIDFEGNGVRIQPPRLIVIDLKTNTILRSHQPNSTVCNAIYTNVFPDVRGSCDDAYAYAVDPSSNGLLVYSFQRDESWRKTHPYFNPDPFQMDYRVNGVSFTWDDGIFGFALAELNKQGDKWAYFHPMSSLNEFTVNTKLLRDPSSKLTTKEVSVIATRNATFQAASQAYDEKTGVLFYSLVNKNGIGCWNTRNQGNFAANSDIVESNDRTMVYFTDIKVNKNNNLWALTNRLPEILYGRGLLSEQVNFRVFTGYVRQLIRNTNCEVNRSFWSRKV